MAEPHASRSGPHEAPSHTRRRSTPRRNTPRRSRFPPVRNTSRRSTTSGRNTCRRRRRLRSDRHARRRMADPYRWSRRPGPTGHAPLTSPPVTTGYRPGMHRSPEASVARAQRRAHHCAVATAAIIAVARVGTAARVLASGHAADAIGSAGGLVGATVKRIARLSPHCRRRRPRRRHPHRPGSLQRKPCTAHRRCRRPGRCCPAGRSRCRHSSPCSRGYMGRVAAGTCRRYRRRTHIRDHCSSQARSAEQFGSGQAPLQQRSVVPGWVAVPQTTPLVTR